MKSSLIISLGVLSILLTGYSTAQNNDLYDLIREIHIGGSGGWDYIAVNPDLKRLYVSHGTIVNILNDINGDSIGIIPNTEGVHGIAFATPFGKGYTSNGRANSSTVFDLKTNTVIGQITTGENPDAIMYDTYSKKIFTCNGRSKDATVIDPATDKVVATIPLAGKPETAVSDGAGNIYVNIEDKNEIVHITTDSFVVRHRWNIGTGDEPAGLAIDKQHHRLFAGCGNKTMIVMNASNGAIVAELPIGDGCDGTAFDAITETAFASNREGTLTVVREVSPDSFQVIQNLPTKRGARTITLDETTHHLFLPTAEYGMTPAATAENPRPRPKIIEGTFEVLEIGQK